MRGPYVSFETTLHVATILPVILFLNHVKVFPMLSEFPVLRTLPCPFHSQDMPLPMLYTDLSLFLSIPPLLPPFPSTTPGVFLMTSCAGNKSKSVVLHLRFIVVLSTALIKGSLILFVPCCLYCSKISLPLPVCRNVCRQRRSPAWVPLCCTSSLRPVLFLSPFLSFSLFLFEIS